MDRGPATGGMNTSGTSSRRRKIFKGGADLDGQRTGHRGNKFGGDGLFLRGDPSLIKL
jgi:hypothetical protein